MEVHFTRETEAKLNRIAAENGSASEAYVRQLVEHYVDYDEWFRGKVKAGLDQLDRGHSLSHDEVVEQIEKLLLA
ncbi:MAG TPA: hypothetical protein VMS37_04880 [Verrucomicrobiae bacterium]|nr:hypothetical protein [Verrucomicrobiae bacterium]